VGQELECGMRYSGRRIAGKAWLETDYLLFRGDQRVKIMLRDLTAVKADDGALRLGFPGGPVELELGPAAVKWAQRILHPPSRMDKLGVKAGTTVVLVGRFGPEFREELRERGAVVRRSGTELIFLAAEKEADLAQVPKLAAGLESGMGL